MTVANGDAGSTLNFLNYASGVVGVLGFYPGPSTTA